MTRAPTPGQPLSETAGERIVKVLICGGREFHDDRLFRETMLDLRTKHGMTDIITGMARGADRMAYEYGIEQCYNVHPYPADWNKHGKAAGPIRNQQMLDEGKPDLVVAFPGGRGTADMVRRAKAAGIQVMEPHP